MRRLFWYWSLVLLCVFGCMESLEKQVQPSPNNILKQTTQDVGEFKPGAGAKVVETKAVYTDPVTGPVNVLMAKREELAKLGIESLVNNFNALEGRYPNSHEEFMTRIIKENSVQLPKLPANKNYQYDVENHKLVVIDAPADTSAEKKDGEAAPANPQ